MCGLAGVVISDKPRNGQELRGIEELFTRLLVGSEHRGPHATGIALVNGSGGHYVAKEPVPASTFVTGREYRRVMDKLDSGTTLLMGHTRWPTRGSHLDNANNHPLVGRGRYPCIITHNGHIANHETLSLALDLRREVEVDSEVILRLAERNVTDACIDPPGFVTDLSHCRGKLSVVAVATSDPTRILLAKGNQPLEVWRNQRRGLIAYASELAILDEAMGSEPGWEEVRLPPWTLMAADAGEAISLTVYPIPHAVGRNKQCR